MTKSVKISLIVVLLTISFMLLLTGMNLYRYYKLRSTIAQNLIDRLNSSQVQKLQNTIEEINSRLLTIKDMGENGLFNLNDKDLLTKKFLPILENQDLFSGLMLADESGKEFSLIKKGQTITIRTCKISSNISKCLYESIDKNKKIIRKWNENINYDPRKRPWFKGAKEQKGIYWSSIYKFFKSKKPGITASISWEKDKFYVFALDMPIDNIQDMLKPSKDIEKQIAFLYNSQSNIFISKNSIGPLNPDSCKEEHNAIICKAIRQWKLANSSNLIDGNEKWYFAIRPLFPQKADFYLGILTSEKALFADLKKGIFKLDPVDIAIAFLGSIMLLGLLWKIGLLNPKSKEQLEPVLRLHNYLSQGEGNRVEFKSTVRTNLKTGKSGKEIELAWLKAVVAFLNTEGGALLIGVDDNGKIIGIEADNFKSNDKCLLHIKNLINQHIGAEFSNFISVTLINVDDKDIIMIECQKAKEPVFLKIGKNEEFYIRSGPSSMKLSPSQTVSYVLQNRSGRFAG